MRKIAVLTVALAAALIFSCTTTTGGDGDGLTQYAFDWAYNLARNFAMDEWDGWDSDTVLFRFICIFADERCMLGRPKEDSLWDFVFQNSEQKVFEAWVEYDGDVGGEEWPGEWEKMHYQEVYSNDKLEEMMTFCLNGDNDYWKERDTVPDDYRWWVYVWYSDWYETYAFEVDFYEDDGDLWGYMIIDTGGEGDDYDILESYTLLDAGPSVPARGPQRPAGLWMER